MGDAKDRAAGAADEGPALTEARPAPGVALLTLNRPARRNALDTALVAALQSAVQRCTADAGVRVLLLAAAGSAFCAGADLRGMLDRGRGPLADNVADARALADLLLAIRNCPKPSVALVQGAAFGGGVGLATACDLAVGSTEARFRLPEVQLGIVPAVISPYLVDAIGPRQARRWCLTGEPIDAARALALGLLHEVVEPGQLEPTGLALAGAIAAGGPLALAACKTLLAGPARDGASVDAATRTSTLLARLRAGEEAREGLLAALEKRAPRWRP